MTEHLRLQNRRASETFELEVAGLRYLGTASWYSDSCVGELFLANGKSNSQENNKDDVAKLEATLASIGSVVVTRGVGHCLKRSQKAVVP
jgi:hypothetical protein